MIAPFTIPSPFGRQDHAGVTEYGNWGDVADIVGRVRQMRHPNWPFGYNCAPPIWLALDKRHERVAIIYWNVTVIHMNTVTVTAFTLISCMMQALKALSL